MPRFHSHREIYYCILVQYIYCYEAKRETTCPKPTGRIELCDRTYQCKDLTLDVRVVAPYGQTKQ